MAGARFPSNGAAPDSGIAAASNRRAASYYATSAQSLYSDLWQDMRNYIDAYCSVTRNQQQHSTARTSSSPLTDFSSSPASNQSSLSYQRPYGTYSKELEGAVNFGNLPKELDGAVNFANLVSLETARGNAHAHAITNDSHAVAPTIQFDLGNNNLLSCSSQQGSLSNNFSSPYNYSSQAAMDNTQADGNQTSFTNDSSPSSTTWNMGNSMGNSMSNNFACPSSGQNSLNSTSLANNGPTVDFTARWGMRNNSAQQSPVNNVRPEPFVGRLRPYVREPSVDVIRGIEIALQTRSYVIDRKLVGDPQSPTACDYRILGPTGSVYTVRLATIPSCTCPDVRHPCKHILFIMLRVLKLSSEDYRIWQDALFSSEVSDLIRKPILDSDALLASQKVRNRFQDLSSHEGVGGSGDVDARLKNLQREVSGDCPVCFEEMGNADGSAKEAVSFCKVCGNNVHKDCFQRWSLSKQEAGERATCIFCRSTWFEDSLQFKKRKAASEVPADGYVNMADYSTNHHQTEDMSLESLYPSMRTKFVPEWRGC